MGKVTILDNGIVIFPVAPTAEYRESGNNIAPHEGPHTQQSVLDTICYRTGRSVGEALKIWDEVLNCKDQPPYDEEYTHLLIPADGNKKAADAAFVFENMVKTLKLHSGEKIYPKVPWR
jgi:hypothetical protein